MHFGTRPKLRTGYVVTVGSVDFSAQGNFADAAELLWLFCEQDIPAEDVIAHIPIVPGRTVVNPSPYVGFERLELPAKYAKRVVRDPGISATFVLIDIRQLAEREDIEAVVWFFLDHEHRDSFMLPSSGAHIALGDIMWLYRDWPREKPLLIVCDSSYSTPFAERVMEELVKCKWSRPTAWLTSGRGKCVTSAIVVSDDDSLVNHDAQTNLRYSISGGLLPRSLIHIIAYTDLNDGLEGLAGRIREAEGAYKDIDASLCKMSGQMGDQQLRDFFGGPIDPNRTVEIGRVRRRFKEIIAEEHGLDDINRFECEGSQCRTAMTAFVRVRRNESGAIEETERGHFVPGDPTLEYLSSRDPPQPPPPPPPSYVPLYEIVTVVLKRLHQRYPRMKPRPWSRESDQYESQLYDFIKDINNIYPSEAIDLGYLTMWSNGVTLEELQAMILEAREDVADVLGIDLNSHDPRRTWWLNRKGSTSSPSMSYTDDIWKLVSQKRDDSNRGRGRAAFVVFVVFLFLFLILGCVLCVDRFVVA
jgi:hypothetical protein